MPGLVPAVTACHGCTYAYLFRVLVLDCTGYQWACMLRMMVRGFIITALINAASMSSKAAQPITAVRIAKAFL